MPGSDLPSELSRRARRFEAALSEPAAHLDEMSLALSAALQPDLDVDGPRRVLDELAAGCPAPTRDGVVEHLFGSGRLRADRHDYDSWRNSCLDQVLARRRGMPITLGVVAIEVGRRAGVPLVGVGLPGHFLVGDPGDGDWFADPFHARSGLDVAGCRALLAAQGIDRWDDRFVAPTPNRLVIARILNNLRAACERRGDRVRLAVVMHLRSLLPELADDPRATRRATAVLN